MNAKSPSPESARLLILVWLALMLLLGLTVGSAYIPMGPFNTIVNLAIAVAKALLVLIFFMHLRNATPAIRLIAAAGFFWLLILAGLGAGDFFARLA